MNHAQAGALIAVLAGSLTIYCIAGLAQVQLPTELRAGNVKVDYLIDQALQQVHEELRKLSYLGDPQRFHELNEVFHNAIYAGSQNA